MCIGYENTMPFYSRDLSIRRVGGGSWNQSPLKYQGMADCTVISAI